MKNQTIYIVDDDETVRNSIKELVESVGLKSRVFTNAVDYLEQYDASHTGCLVLDIRMAIISGLELQKKLNQLNSIIPIIFVTKYADIDVVKEAFREGAFDFIVKPYHEQNLLDSINSALKVDIECRVTISEQKEFKSKAKELTSRERQVLSLVVDGMTNKEIANHLTISHRTVEIHRQRALRKLGSRSFPEIKNNLSNCI